MNRKNPYFLLPLLLVSLVAIFNSVGEVRPNRILALYGSGIFAGVVLTHFIFALRSRREPEKVKAIVNGN